MAVYKNCKRKYHRKTGKAMCLCTTSSGRKVFAPKDNCGRQGMKAACVSGSARYVKGGACFCATKGGGGKFISKSICKRKYKK